MTTTPNSNLVPHSLSAIPSSPSNPFVKLLHRNFFECDHKKERGREEDYNMGDTA